MMGDLAITGVIAALGGGFMLASCYILSHPLGARTFAPCEPSKPLKYRHLLSFHNTNPPARCEEGSISDTITPPSTQAICHASLSRRTARRFERQPDIAALEPASRARSFVECSSHVRRFPA